MALVFKLTFRFNPISNKIPGGLFIDIDTLMLNLYGIAKDLEWAKNNLEKEEQLRTYTP